MLTGAAIGAKAGSMTTLSPRRLAAFALSIAMVLSVGGCVVSTAARTAGGVAGTAVKTSGAVAEGTIRAGGAVVTAPLPDGEAEDDEQDGSSQ